MSLSPGSVLGTHEIVGLLGAGGMGEVYRARDTKLNRQVAIKVLPEAYASDPDRVARFHREAQAIAALNHPNIAAIYDLAESGATKFLVLELIEGETLADRLRRGAVPPEEALDIIKQVLEALEVAHEKAICHRDLKPANIKITADGAVKVLDFGLAKFMQTPGSQPLLTNSPTLSVAGTYPGVILGTAGYMSPEQAKGYEADHRSDLFSVGCILYELLSGHQAFEGETASEILAGVLKSDVDFSRLPSRLNPRVVDLLRRCLEKSPKKRWHAAADVRAEVESLIGRAAQINEQTSGVGTSLWRRALPIAAALVAGMALAASATWLVLRSPGSDVAKLVIPLQPGEAFTNPGRPLIAISPDGTKIVYVANNRLNLRPVDAFESQVIKGTDLGTPVMNPVFSPDGQSIAFFSAFDSTLKRVPVTGGVAATICSATAPWGMDWSGDHLVFGQAGRGIFRVSGAGGTPEQIVTAAEDAVVAMPRLLSGGRSVLFTMKKAGAHWDTGTLVVQDGSGRQRAILEGGSDGRIVGTGHVIFAHSGVLMAAPFDAAALTVAGAAVNVIEGVRRGGIESTGLGAAHVSIAENGVLVYLPGAARLDAALGNSVLAFYDGITNAQPINVPRGIYRSPRVSPDGKFVAYDSDNGKESAVWVVELADDRAPQRLTLSGNNRHPIWSRDGRWIVFQSDRDGDLALFRQWADGSRPAERLTNSGTGVEHVPQSFAANDTHLLFSSNDGKESSLWVLDMTSRLAAEMPGIRSIDSAEGTFSPDGQWIAYRVREPNSTQGQVFVQPFPLTGAKYLVRSGGHPFWRNNSELIMNVGPGQSVRMPFVSRPRVSIGPASEFSRVDRTEGPTGITRRNVDAMPDGKRVLGVMSEASPANADPRIHVVLNWFHELKQRVPLQ